MPFYKAWLETRWRFLSGLAVMVCAAAAIVLAYPRAVAVLREAARFDRAGELGRQIAENLDLLASYQGYIWSQWFRQTMRQLWALFAVMLGTGGLLAQTSSGGALYTLSLPLSRARLLGIRAATALAELAVLAVVPALVVPLASPAVGQSYSVVDALVYGLCMFLAGSTLFSLTFLLSTVFADIWRPPLIVLCLAGFLALVREALQGPSTASLLGVMTAESYFRGNGLPWLGLLGAVALSLLLLFAATRNIARQDF
jgi:hypothetical protein